MGLLKKVEALRRKHRISKAELCAQAGYTDGYYYRMLTGRKPETTKAVKAFVDALDHFKKEETALNKRLDAMCRDAGEVSL